MSKRKIVRVEVEFIQEDYDDNQTILAAYSIDELELKAMYNSEAFEKIVANRIAYGLRRYFDRLDWA